MGLHPDFKLKTNILPERYQKEMTQVFGSILNKERIVSKKCLPVRKGKLCTICGVRIFQPNGRTKFCKGCSYEQSNVLRNKKSHTYYQRRKMRKDTEI